MKKLILLFLVCISFFKISTAQSFLCNEALPFCSGTAIEFPACTGCPPAQDGPEYGCLGSQPNPAWYYLQIGQTGEIIIEMYSTPEEDIDFVAWGPFTDPVAACNNQLTAVGSVFPNNTSPDANYPYGNLVDCSYSGSSTETLHISGIAGQYYIIMITNFSDNQCNIVFDQTNLDAPDAGTTNCGIIFHATNDGPKCVGDTLRLFSGDVANGTYSWVGPGGFHDTTQNPVIPNISASNAGTYTVTVTIFGVPTSDSTEVEIFANPNVTSHNTAICKGNTATLTATGAATYTWSTLATTASITVSPLADSTFYVLGINNNGCKDTAMAHVIVHPNPIATFSAPPVCGSLPPAEINPSTIVYTGPLPATNLAFAWSFEGPAHPDTASILQNPVPHYWSDVDSATNYDISLTVTDTTTGCHSSVTGQIQIIPSSSQPNCCIVPPTDAGPHDSICGVTYPLAGSNNPSTIGYWTLMSGPGTATFSPDTNYYNATVTVSVTGQYKFRWHENSGITCFNNDSVIVEFIQIPVANAGEDQMDICGISTTLAANTDVGTGIWEEIGNHTIFSPVNSSVATTSIDLTYGIHEYMWILNNFGCRDTDYVKIQYHEIPLPDAGLPQTICGKNAELTGTSASSIVDGYWTGPLGAIFTNGNNSNPANILMLNSPATPVKFWWHQINAMCVDSDFVEITFQTSPIGAEAGADKTICSANPCIMTGEVVGGTATGLWTSLDQVVITNDTSPNASVMINFNDTLFDNNSQYIASLVWTVTSAAGCVANDTMKIKFFQSPVANAGWMAMRYNMATCGTSQKLGAIPSITAFDGNWSVAPQSTLLCPTSQFSNSGNPGSNVTGCPGQALSFVWTEKNHFSTLCVSTDTILVEFVKTPDIEAGDSISVCGNKVQLHAVSDTASEFRAWSTVNNISVTYLDTNGINPEMTQNINPDAWVKKPYASNITVKFIWTEYNMATISNLPFELQCFSRDTVPVTFFVDYPATLLMADSNFICGYIDSTLHAAQPPEGTGKWVDVTGIATFTPSTFPANLNSRIEVQPPGIKHTLYWIVENGKCVDSSNAITVQFIDLPVANSGGTLWAGNPNPSVPIKWDTVCGNSYTLHPKPFGTATPLWTSTNNNVKFSASGSTTTGLPNDNVISDLYNSVIVNPSYYSLAFTLDNSILTYPPFTRGCKHTDTLRLTFAKIPTGKIDFKKAFCYGDSIPVSAKQDLEGKPNYFVWDFQGGKIDTIIDNIETPYLKDSVYYVTWDTVGGDTSHIVKLITESTWGCRSKQITDTIFEPEAQYPSDSLFHASCYQDNGKIKLNLISNLDTTKYSYKWIDPIFATSSSVLEREYLSSGVPYHFLLSYKSWDPDKTCKVYFTETLRDTGEVFAEFRIASGTDTVHIVPGAEILFKNLTEGGKTYEWHFGDGGISTAENPPHVFVNGGRYEIYLIAKSKEDCENKSESLWLEVESQSSIIVPNIFTPNGDGKNDYFQVKAKSLKSFHGIITNRWGKTLYQWDVWDSKLNPNSGWDGKISNGEAASGVYYYIITGEGYDNITYELKGAFHLEQNK